MTTIDLPNLIAQAYEAASHSDGVANLIHDTADFFGVRKIAVAVWSPTNPDTFLPITDGISSKDFQSMFDRRGQSGTLFEKLNNLSSGETFAAEACGQETPAGALRHETDAMHTLAGVFIDSANNRCAIVLFREPQNREFNQAEQENLQTLMNYYQRARELNRRSLRIFLERKTAFTVLESAPQGIFFLGQSGQVTYQNVEARLIFTLKDGLRLNNGLVRIDDPVVHQTLDNFIDRMRSADNADCPDTLACAIPRKSNAAPYQLIVSKLSFEAERAALNSGESLATAVISDPEDMGELKLELLRTFFGLSAAEARLARALYKFNVLANAAEALGISVHTARSELKKVFKKLDVNSQPALLKKLARAIQQT